MVLIFPVVDPGGNVDRNWADIPHFDTGEAVHFRADMQVLLDNEDAHLDIIRLDFHLSQLCVPGLAAYRSANRNNPYGLAELSTDWPALYRIARLGPHED